MKLFLSHASRDKDLARVVVELLMAGLQLQISDILCTCIDGCGIEAGSNIDERLRTEALEAEAFIGLVSKSSLCSPYVFFELGARWGACKHLIPLLAEDIVLPAPLSSINSLRCNNEAHLYQLIEELRVLLNAPKQPPHSYHRYVREVYNAAVEHASTELVSAVRELNEKHKRILRALFDETSRRTFEAANRVQYGNAFGELIARGYVQKNKRRGHSLTQLGIRITREYLSSILY